MADTVFKDFDRRNITAKRELAERIAMLERQEAEEEVLPEGLQEELDIKTKVGKRKIIDPLFLGLRAALETTNPGITINDHTDGKMSPLQREEKLFAAVYGLLAADNQEPRDAEWEFDKKAPKGKKVVVFKTDDARFKKAVAHALGEYSATADLFDKTLDTIANEGGGVLDTVKWATVVRKLRARGVPADHPNLDLLTSEALADEISSSDSAAPSSVDLDFPNLEDASDVQIVVNNVKSMMIFYPSWMLDEARFYDVYDKIEELFLNQMLPVSRGTAGDQIYRRWKKSTQRISKAERLNFYATCFGATGGNPGLANVNNQFSDIWLRFVSGVSEWARKLNVDDMLRTRIPLSVSTEQVRKAARDLAANLSLHGYGVAYFAATELQNEINDIKDILSDEEVRLAYGARDMRQLIEQVSIYELGGARDVTRYFTMATAGAVIIAWLAKKAPDLSGVYSRPILDVNVVRKPTTRPSNVKATRDPTDRDLVDACEQWLAVTGTSDERVSEFAQPSETAAMTSRPVSIPQVAREALEAYGITAGVGSGNGNGSTRYAGRR